MSRETISALVDSEAPGDFAWPSALAMLQTEEGRADWDLYHRIGDTLRASELADNLSPGFAARMAARMAAEAPLGAARGQAPVPAALFDTSASRAPLSYAEATRGARMATPMLPVLCAAEAEEADAMLRTLRTPVSRLSARQLTLSMSAMGAALVVVAAAAYLTAPPLGTHGRTAPLSGAELTATHLAAGEQVPESTDHILVAGKAARQAAPMTEAADDAEDLGAYVRAHQDVTPSPYRSARLVRPAAMPAASAQ